MLETRQLLSIYILSQLLYASSGKPYPWLLHGQSCIPILITPLEK